MITMLTRLSAHQATVSAPISAAAAKAWDDDTHVEVQRQRYRRGRDLLVSALRGAGFELEDPQGGLYLWVSAPGLDDWRTAAALAERGILGVPGRYYHADDEPRLMSGCH